MPTEFLQILNALEVGSFVQGLTAGTAGTVITLLVIEHLRWSPKNIFQVTRQLVGKRGLVGLAESVGFSVLIDTLKLPVDLATGLYRRKQSPLLAPRTRRQRKSAVAADTRPCTLRQAFTAKVIEGAIEDLRVDISAGDSPRVTASVVLTQEDAPWLM